MRLIVAEKPSVGRDLARAVGASQRGDGCLDGDGVRVTWCIGHLLEFEEPAAYDPRWKRWSLDALPIVPTAFRTRPRSEGRDQLTAVVRHLRDKRVREVVNATDAGREGELIFWLVYEHAGIDKPVRRLWTSSLTPDALADALARLRPTSATAPLPTAARARAEADWLVGMNATRALTARLGELATVGRVQTPTLALIAARDRAIADFVPQTYWTVQARFGTGAGPIAATWFARDSAPEPDDDRNAPAEQAPPAERISHHGVAEALAGAVSGRPATVRSAQRKTVREPPPEAYDLTSLQRAANSRYGLPAPRTLEIAQALYERHKLITYPRTDARRITPNEVSLLPGILRGLAGLPVYRPTAEALLAAPLRLDRRFVDASEVGDHHAILPTGRTPDAERLAPDEKRVYDLIARRLLAVLSPDAVFDVALIVLEVDAPDAPLPPLFRARGRIARIAGWRAVDPPGRSATERELPMVHVGDPAKVDASQVEEGTTRPPRPHNDASLLRAMETAGRELDDDALRRAMRGAGLGTPATRAAILQTLLDRSYVRRDGRALHATDAGRRLLDANPVPELANAELTARWEGRLFELAEGKGDAGRFHDDVVANVTSIVEAIRQAAVTPAPADVSAQAIGSCPGCGTPVRADRFAWVCDSRASCGFRVPKTMARRKVSDRLVRSLVTHGRTPIVQGWRSKAGKPFAAGLHWDKAANKVGFVFEDQGPRVGGACPACEIGRIIAGKSSLGCDRWREGCAWRGPAMPAPTRRARRPT